MYVPRFSEQIDREYCQLGGTACLSRSRCMLGSKDPGHENTGIMAWTKWRSLHQQGHHACIPSSWAMRSPASWPRSAPTCPGSGHGGAGDVRPVPRVCAQRQGGDGAIICVHGAESYMPPSAVQTVGIRVMSVGGEDKTFPETGTASPAEARPTT
jgi:hypothetical protein